MSAEQPTCFVIIPFSVREHDLEKYDNDIHHLDEVLEGLIRPAVEAAGMQLLRDDQDYSSRLVGEGIWKKIEDADVVLCDLSSLNPNVYLKLGWAIRADKKFVLIKDELTDFSFDLNQFHTCVYSSKLKPSSLKTDVKKLSRAIQETSGDEDQKYSMVKRIALTTAIEMDASTDKQTMMLESIYKKLDNLEIPIPATIDAEPGYTDNSDNNQRFKVGSRVLITSPKNLTPGLDPMFDRASIQLEKNAVQKWDKGELEEFGAGTVIGRLKNLSGGGYILALKVGNYIGSCRSSDVNLLY